MPLTNEQYERIARYLDAEPVSLTDAERAVAEELRAAERRVGTALDFTPPPAAVERAHQHVLREEIHRDEAALADLLDADVPRRAIGRAYRRVLAEMARPQRRLMRIGSVAAGVAAAAAILLAVAVLSSPPRVGEPVQMAQPPAGAVPVEILAESVEEPEDVAVDLLAAEIDQLEADFLAAAPPTPVDMGIDQIERALEEYWLDDMLE